jgi:hypothetical protein
MHKPEVAAAVDMYDDGGTEVFAAWEIVNQFTPTNELRWDPGEAAFVVTAHQEGRARVAARQWATGELSRCVPAAASTNSEYQQPEYLRSSTAVLWIAPRRQWRW